jgi:hypothetical protein
VRLMMRLMVMRQWWTMQEPGSRPRRVLSCRARGWMMSWMKAGACAVRAASAGECGCRRMRTGALVRAWAVGEGGVTRPGRCQQSQLRGDGYRCWPLQGACEGY